MKQTFRRMLALLLALLPLALPVHAAEVKGTVLTEGHPAEVTELIGFLSDWDEDTQVALLMLGVNDIVINVQLPEDYTLDGMPLIVRVALDTPFTMPDPTEGEDGQWPTVQAESLDPVPFAIVAVLSVEDDHLTAWETELAIAGSVVLEEETPVPEEIASYYYTDAMVIAGDLAYGVTTYVAYEEIDGARHLLWAEGHASG